MCHSVCMCLQGGTMLGPPDTVVELGNTEVTEEIFMDYLSSLGETTYRCVLDYCLLLKIKWGITFTCIAWIHHKPLFLVWCLSTVATSTDCLNTTVTRSLMRWPSFSQAIKFPPISQIYPLKCSPREYAKHGIAQTCLHISRFSGLFFISTSTMGKYSGTTYRE